jgi:hypothetical protein
MIKCLNDKDVEVSYTVSKAEVHAANNWEEMMKFIIDHRPIVVHQFWIDTGTIDAPITSYKMLFSKVEPIPDEIIPSDI